MREYNKILLTYCFGFLYKGKSSSTRDKELQLVEFTGHSLYQIADMFVIPREDIQIIYQIIRIAAIVVLLIIIVVIIRNSNGNGLLLLLRVDLK